MYSGGFYPFPDDETRWAWWARHIYFNRYIDAQKPVYGELLNLGRNIRKGLREIRRPILSSSFDEYLFLFGKFLFVLLRKGEM